MALTEKLFSTEQQNHILCISLIGMSDTRKSYKVYAKRTTEQAWASPSEDSQVHDLMQPARTHWHKNSYDISLL